MGAQQKGIPLNIDFNQAFTRHRVEETPDLIITGKQERDNGEEEEEEKDREGRAEGNGNGNRQDTSVYMKRRSNESEDKLCPRLGSDQADENKISLLTDDKLKQYINKFTSHLKLTLNDNGMKIRTLLVKFNQEKERRERLKDEVKPRRDNSKITSAKIGPIPSRFCETGDSLTNSKSTAFTGDEWDFVNKKDKAEAFHFEVTSMRGMPCNEYAEKERATGNHISNGRTTLMSSIPMGDCEKRSEYTSKGILGKRQNTFHGNKKILSNTSADFVQSCTDLTPVNNFSQEVHTSEDMRATTRSFKIRHSIGASLDTAMELSDDDEKVESGCPENGDLHDHTFRSKCRWEVGFRLAYPRDDPEAVEVQQSDLRHLDPFEFLNDTVIDFYIKYIQRPENLNEERRGRFLFFNTFFFKKLLLERPKGRSSDCYSKLRKWVRGVNIFEKYLVVPIHESAHWSLVLVCFSFEKESKMQPYILHLDSLKEGHVTGKVVQVFESYLKAEWHHMGGIDGVDRNWEALSERVDVPQQQNDWDCGLFLLFFIQRFVEDAPLEFTSDSLNSMFGRNWFKPQEASKLRVSIKNLLKTLVKEQNVEIMMEDMD